MRLPRDVLAFTVWRNYTGARRNLVHGRIEVQYGNGAGKRNQYGREVSLCHSLYDLWVAHIKLLRVAIPKTVLLEIRTRSAIGDKQIPASEAFQNGQGRRIGLCH